jgi:NADH-quinone oxidoreductase subunit M
MTDLHLPLLEITILIPLLGALVVGRIRDPYRARQWSVYLTGATFLCALITWQDFHFLGVKLADDPGHLFRNFLDRELFVIDELSAPLLPVAALIYFLTIVTTMKTKMRRFSFAWSLLSEANLLAMFSCRDPWYLLVFLALGTVLPYVELRVRNKPTRVFLLHLVPYFVLMVVGWAMIEREGTDQMHSLWALSPLLIAVFIRSGVFPFHTWVRNLFDGASFGTALLFSTPLVGAYACCRFVLPVAEESVLRSVGTVALVTAVYASGLALVQRDIRSFFCYLFLSHSSLVLVGLDVVQGTGLTGALCVWLSVSLAMTGFGLTLRAIESRFGNLSIHEFHGLYEHTPALAVSFFLTGLASIGFPGMMGFIGTEMLVDGAVGTYPLVGVAVVIASALNGIAFVKVYFNLFTGKRHASTVSLGIGLRERLAVLAVAGILLAGGIAPRYVVDSRHVAAEELLEQRPAVLNDDDSDDEEDDDDEHEEMHDEKDEHPTSDHGAQERNDD